MQVTLDVFSGQPNPSWELTAEEAQELSRRLTRSTRTDQAPTAQGLGYRGFLIANPERKSGVPAEVRVFAGIVTSQEGEEITNFLDLDGVEHWLVDQARKRGFGDLVG
jgi:hypothetical protein